jgi:hypothetical protein
MPTAPMSWRTIQPVGRQNGVDGCACGCWVAWSMFVFGYRAHQGPSGYAEGICVEQDAVEWKGKSVSAVRALPKSAPRAHGKVQSCRMRACVGL